MGNGAKTTRQNRTITVDFQDPFTYFELISNGKAFVEFVLAFILSLGFQLAHKATCTGGGCLTRHSYYARIRLGGLIIWRIQCTSCKAVFTVLPHFALRYRRMSPDVARQALIATHGGLSLEWSATICHISPMALYRLIGALGQHSLVTVLVKCRLPLPAYILADEKHSRCLTDRVYLPNIVSGRVIWHLGYSDSKSAAAFTASYGQFQQAALAHEPSYLVKGPTELKLRYHLTNHISLLQRDLQDVSWLFSVLPLISDFAQNRHYSPRFGPSPAIFRRFLQRSASAKCNKGNSGDTRGSLLGLVTVSVL